MAADILPIVDGSIAMQDGSLLRSTRVLVDSEHAADPMFRFLTPGTIVPANSRNSSVFEQIKQRIVDCDEGHIDCKIPMALDIPFRLIQVDP